MNLSYCSLLALSLASALSTSALAEPAAKMRDGVLANASGMTLYTFDKDVAGSGKSACSGACLALWPAFTASADAKPEGDFSLVSRDEGGQQWAYRGKPLYTFANDKQAGDRLGDNVKDVWHVVR